MTTAEIMDAMKYDGALVTIERLQVHAARLERLLSNERERCAKVADGYNYGPCGQYDYSYTDADARADDRASQIANDIRALPEAK